MPAQASQMRNFQVKPEIEAAVGGKDPEGGQKSCWRQINRPFHLIATCEFGHRWRRVLPKLGGHADTL